MTAAVERYFSYIQLMRLNKPIGITLLLWPTLWALWLAARGFPELKILSIFIAGVLLMRSAGCVMNDIFDRNFDGHVRRTRHRPIATGEISVKQALILAALLALSAFVLVLSCNQLTIMLAIVGAILAVTYPLLKRVTHLPQAGLGFAFSWGVPMAFAAINNAVTRDAWLVFVAAAIWPVIYDTMYAMIDRGDDIRIGVKSTAILFGRYDVVLLASLMVLFIALLILIGFVFHLSRIYFFSLAVTGILFLRQLWLIRTRHPDKCFQAFLENNWIGMIIFLGVSCGLQHGVGI